MSSESSNRLLFDTEDGEPTIRKGLDPRRKRMYLLLVGVLVVSIVIGIIVLAVANKSCDDENNDPRQQQKTYDDYQNQYIDSISADNIKENMKQFSSFSHIAGSPADFAQANDTKNRFESFGIPSTIEEIPVFLTYPLSRTVEIVGGFKCSLKESIVADGTSNLPAIDTFHGYSPSGEATGQLVYANYGREEDYVLLDQLKVNLTGKIVIVRYGKIFRGNKVLGAQQRGAIGVLIYTDPEDTGYDMGKPYLDGPWSTNTSVQRGSVWIGYGDPTTPGWGSTKDGARLNFSQARDPNLTLNLPLPLIPSQPLSWSDASPLLQTLTSGNLPSPTWQGGLPFSYHIGPSSQNIHMSIKVNETITNIWNVLGKIPGKFEPDRLIVVGCHRDAWTFGAGDPISAHSTLLEVARAMGQLYKNGWQPRRSIVFASWDAEEYGLVGSTEFVEGNLASLMEKTVVYFNIDIAVKMAGKVAVKKIKVKGRDYLLSKGSPSITDLILEATQKVTLEGKSVKDKWEGTVHVPGTGSDFVAFIHHAGIAMNHMEFKSLNNTYEAVYHSNYDSFYWFSHFGDPDFSYHAAIGKVLGYCVMRFGNSLVVPMGLKSYSNALNTYIAQIRNGTSLDFTPMTDATAQLSDAISALEAKIKLANAWDDSISDEDVRAINDRLMFFERSFLTDESRLTGLSPWFKHIVLAPSKYDGYAGVAFGALAGAVQQADWTEAEYLIQRYALIIEGAAKALKDDPL